MRSVGIFCGSANGNDPVYSKAASQVGQRLAEQGVGIVYGGGKVGLMGPLLMRRLQHGGSVIGVIPQSLVAREIAHTGIWLNPSAREGIPLVPLTKKQILPLLMKAKTPINP